MLNQCTFIGHLGADPEIRRTADGRPIANLSLGVTEKWKSKDGERKERTEWVRVVIFSEGLCRVAESYLRKGSKILAQGQLQTRKWQDQSGADRYSTEIVLQGFNASLVMLDGKSEGGSQSSGKQQSYGEASGGNPSSVGPDDEIPFAPEWR